MYFRALNLAAHFLTRFHKNADICGVQKLLTYQEISAAGEGGETITSCKSVLYSDADITVVFTSDRQCH